MLTDYPCSYIFLNPASVSCCTYTRAGKIKSLIDRSVVIHEQLEGKVGAAFTSSGGTAYGAETTLLSLLHMLLIHGMIVQGRSQIAHYGAAAVGGPDAKELASCHDLGERTARLSHA